MVFIDSEVICQKHPHHKQHPGVCSCCLRERLVNLSTSTPTISLISSSCTYSLSSSKSSSTCDSPRGGRGHRRITSDVVGPFSFVNIIGTSVGGGLKKSRSIAFVARDGLNGQKKKEGFWSKLMRSTGKRSKTVLVH